ncbi:Chaperone protein dnaJ [Termitomyces sp. T112]|nr:Chaperone protein dnaJ [Termitomyces sp. T112]
MFQGIVGAMPLPLLSLVGWSIVPDFITKNLLSLLHRFAILSVPTTQPAYRKQYALTFACVVLGYLSYNLIDSARSMPPNFYQILGVEPMVDEQGLKVAFRHFAKRNHPDRPGVGRDGEELFIMVRDVYEALKNPVVRFAYDRFGPDVLQWSKTCTTTREYIQRGLIQSSGYHVVVGSFLIFWSFVGSSSGPNPVSFWRYLLYATLFVAEISLILSPSPSSLPTSTLALKGLVTTYTTHTPLHTLFPQRLIFQHILFLHQLFVFLSFALGRVVPVLLSAFSPNNTLSPAQTQELIQEIFQLASIADRETSMSSHILLHSIASPESTTSSPPSAIAPPHEDISSFARPHHFVIPPRVLDLSDPRTQNSRKTTSPDKVAEAGNKNHPLVQLTREIEELVVENNIKKGDGPFRSVWQAAVRRGRDSLASLSESSSIQQR